MLENILFFKNQFLYNKEDEIENFDDFIHHLIDFNQASPLLLSDEKHWHNYFHAAAVSALQECLGYSLLNWTLYFASEDVICENLNVKKPTEGKVLEYFVLHSINYVFDFSEVDLKIKAVRSNDDRNPAYLTDDTNNPGLFSPPDNERLLNNLRGVMKIRGIGIRKIWGDNDIIVVLEHHNILQQFCVISCKTSLRERVYQSVFWAMRSRTQGIGKHVFVTADKGDSSKNSEIGNRAENGNAKKSRDVLESTMDRVYVLRNQEEVARSQVIKDFLHLQKDLILWAKDIAGI